MADYSSEQRAAQQRARESIEIDRQRQGRIAPPQGDGMTNSRPSPSTESREQAQRGRR